jgi:hypothetical protein
MFLIELLPQLCKLCLILLLFIIYLAACSFSYTVLFLLILHYRSNFDQYREELRLKVDGQGRLLFIGGGVSKHAFEKRYRLIIVDDFGNVVTLGHKLYELFLIHKFTQRLQVLLAILVFLGWIDACKVLEHMLEHDIVIFEAGLDVFLLQEVFNLLILSFVILSSFHVFKHAI